VHVTVRMHSRYKCQKSPTHNLDLNKASTQMEIWTTPTALANGPRSQRHFDEQFEATIRERHKCGPPEKRGPLLTKTKSFHNPLMASSIADGALEECKMITMATAAWPKRVSPGGGNLLTRPLCTDNKAFILLMRSRPKQRVQIAGPDKRNERMQRGHPQQGWNARQSNRRFSIVHRARHLIARQSLISFRRRPFFSVAVVYFLASPFYLMYGMMDPIRRTRAGM